MIKKGNSARNAQNWFGTSCRWIGGVCLVMALALLVPEVVTAEGTQEVDMAGLQEQVDNLTRMVAELEQTAPRNQVVAFRSEKCPLGWEEYEPAYGRFIRGIDRNKANKIDPDGERSAGEPQEDNVGEHQHIYRGEGSTGYTYAERGDERRLLWFGNDWEQKNPRETEMNPTGETRPVNVALLYCRKN